MMFVLLCNKLTAAKAFTSLSLSLVGCCFLLLPSLDLLPQPFLSLVFLCLIGHLHGVCAAGQQADDAILFSFALFFMSCLLLLLLLLLLTVHVLLSKQLTAAKAFASLSFFSTRLCFLLLPFALNPLPFFASLGTFLVLLGNKLTAAKVFTSSSLFR